MTNTVLINSSYDNSYDKLFGEDWCILHESSCHSPYIPWDTLDLVLLVGAHSDVDPNTYGEVPEPRCGSVDRLQDLETFTLMDLAETYDVPVIGICKGAQQMCVYHGGRLIQHVQRVGKHGVRYNDSLHSVPADHHQVMVPPPGAGILAESDERGYPEEVQFSSRTFGFQYHPEWDISKGYASRRFDEVLKEILQ